MSDRTIRVLHVSSHYEDCGIAKYLGHYIKGMEDVKGVQNDYFETSPYETFHMSSAELQSMARRLQQKLKDYDLLHVQHEFAIYGSDAFRRIVMAGKAAGKKVIVTAHISPAQHGDSKTPRLTGLGPRSFMHLAREIRRNRAFRAIHMTPFLQADLILAHNERTMADLKRLGVKPDRIRKIEHPVQVFEDPKPTHFIADSLHKQQGDIIFCIIGFLHRYKGITEAVKALKFLPANYKLAVLGGMKEDSNDVAFYDKLCDLIDTLGLRDRVYITGYVKDDNQLNAYIRECDVCVYPYDKIYYAAVSSGSLNLAFANAKPAIAFPTDTIRDLSRQADGAVILCETFAYYELARELQRIDLKKQAELSRAYAKKMAWPNVSKQLAEIYKHLAAN